MTAWKDAGLAAIVAVLSRTADGAEYAPHTIRPPHLRRDFDILLNNKNLRRKW